MGANFASTSGACIFTISGVPISLIVGALCFFRIPSSSARSCFSAAWALAAAPGLFDMDPDSAPSSATIDAPTAVSTEFCV